MNLHTGTAGARRRLARVGGAGRPVTGERIITGLFPATSIADEILTDDPTRFRAMIVESSNPAHSLADSPRMREALAALDLLVVIDVAMTETARLRRLRPAGAVAVREVGGELLQPRVPATTRSSCARRSSTRRRRARCAEPEIHRRLVRALGALDDDDLAGLREAAGGVSLREAFAARWRERPSCRPRPGGPLRDARPDAARRGGRAAALWGAAQMCAASYPELGAARRASRARGCARRGAVRGRPARATRAGLHGRRPRVN